MSRIPLSDESDIELDDEIINDEVGTVGAEEQYEDLDFSERFAERAYEPEDGFDPEEEDLAGEYDGET